MIGNGLQHIGALLVRAVLVAVITIALAWGMSLAIGNDAEQRTDRNTQVILSHVQDIHDLLCETLMEADNPELVRALREHCR